MAGWKRKQNTKFTEIQKNAQQ